MTKIQSKSETTSGRVIALIPARSGSKSLTDKNIQNFSGIPLFMHSIKVAQSCSQVYKVFLSTDSKVYVDIAIENGFFSNYIRSIESSSDRARDIDVIKDFLEKKIVTESVSTLDDILLYLRPTFPLRSSEFIDNSIVAFRSKSFSMARSVRESSETPFKMWHVSENGCLFRVVGSIQDDMHNSPRQDLPKTYWQDGYLDLFRICCLVSSCDKHDGIQAVLSPQELPDIDYGDELIKAEVDSNNWSSKTNIESELQIRDRSFRAIDSGRYSS